MISSIISGNNEPLVIRRRNINQTHSWIWMSYVRRSYRRSLSASYFNCAFGERIISTIQLHIFSCGSVSSVILDFNALIFVMVSNRNLLVSRMGVSLMMSPGLLPGDGGGGGGTVVAVVAVVFFFDGALLLPPTATVLDDGKIHLLYIVAVGRLNGIILHRWSILSGRKLTCSDKMTNLRLSDM